jgi:hypothetical protein
MQRKGLARRLIAAAPLIACGMGVVCAAAARADDDNDARGSKCSNETLEGSYAFTIEGLLGVPGPGLPLRGVVLQRYDGDGNITQVDHVVVNGTPPSEAWRPGTGTYSVNADCTGTATLNIPGSGGPPLVVYFVVAKHGKEIRQVVNGNAIIATGDKVE